MGCNGTVNSLKIKTKKHLQARNMFFNSKITNMATIQCHGNPLVTQLYSKTSFER